MPLKLKKKKRDRISNKRRIYLLKDLSPEVKAVTFAKCSRTSESFSEIAEELTEEKSKNFHEKWVVGYGHSSVAEHAVLSIAVENVSIIASKVIENNRLCSYTEKSTRYQKFDKNRYLKPRKIIASPFSKIYKQTGDFLFKVYEYLTPKIMNYLMTLYPKEKGVANEMYEKIIRAKALDNTRYLLPAATLTNLGWTVNARNLEHAISKMLTHPLEEIQKIGKKDKKVSEKECPTLIKYADRNSYLAYSEKAIRKMANKYLKSEKKLNQNPVELIFYDKDAENKLVAAVLYRGSNMSYRQILNQVKKMSKRRKEEIFNEVMKKRGRFDAPLRELEHTDFTFDILIDFGAFRDIQRHRICTQTDQLLTADWGYNYPEHLIEAGYKKEFELAMKKAIFAYTKISKHYPYEAQYILPLAFKKRVLITWNLRELHHFISLRSSPQGHFSYRQIAQKVYFEIKKKLPFLAKYIRVNLEGTRAHK